MSFLELLLNQKLVIISIAAAGGLLALAVMLSVVPAIFRARKKAVEKRQEARSQKKAAKAQKHASKREKKQERPAKKRAAETESAPARPAEADDIQPAPTATEDPPPFTAVVEEESEETELESSGEEQEEEAVSSAIQEIISSVFEDEESMARYEALLYGLDNPSSTSLAALAERIRDSLEERR